MTGRDLSRAAETAGVVAVVGLCALLLFTPTTLEGADRDLFGITFDARVVYVVAGVLGLVAVVWRRLLVWWSLAMTAATLGRAVTLVVDGTGFDVPRSTEWRAAGAWFVLWLAGGLAAIVLEGTASLRRSIAR